MQFHGTDPDSIRARLAEIAEAERYDRRQWWHAVLLVNVWWLLGLLIVAAGLHITDPGVGAICLATGPLVGTGGPLLALIRLSMRME